MKRLALSLGIPILAGVVFLGIGPSQVLADDNQDCLNCHADYRLVKVTQQEGKTSLYVNPADLASSVHAEFDCTTCHQDFDAGGLHDSSLITPLTKLSEAEVCSSCHQEESAVFLASSHGDGLMHGSNESATCSDCHSTRGSLHNIQNAEEPQSPIYPANIAVTCAACHAEASLMTPFGIKSTVYDTYRDSVHGQTAESSPDDIATCTGCHGNHDVGGARSFSLTLAANCATCHEDEYNDYKVSVYGRGFFSGNPDVPDCLTCHSVNGQRHEIAPISSEESPVYRRNISDTCCTCHEDKELMAKYGIIDTVCVTYKNSFHAKATILTTDAQLADKDYATCSSCHGSHKVLASDDPASPVYDLEAIAVTCSQCHEGANTNFAASFHNHKIPTAENEVGTFIVNVVYGYLLIPAMVVFGTSFIILDFLRSVVTRRQEARGLARRPPHQEDK
jgi:hypothetical protein